MPLAASRCPRFGAGSRLWPQRSNVTRRSWVSRRGTNHRKGCAHAACRRCRSRSKSSRSKPTRTVTSVEETAGASPKRETAPGEATSGAGSRWQNREIDTNQTGALGILGGSCGDGNDRKVEPVSVFIDVRPEGRAGGGSDRSMEGISGRGRRRLFTETCRKRSRLHGSRREANR